MFCIIDLESADVQSNPKLFRLDQHGKPKVVTGTPPDVFTDDGQRWGHPHYNWQYHKRTEFLWWQDRFRRAYQMYDAVRLDHFVGFQHLYEIPARARTARHGNGRGRSFVTKTLAVAPATLTTA